MHATTVNAPGEPVTTVRMVSYTLPMVSAVIVPLAEGVNLYQMLFEWPLLAAPVVQAPG